MEGGKPHEGKSVLIRADYGHIALHLREIMEERGASRAISFAKRIDARFEVVNKWYQGAGKNGSGYPQRVSAMHWTAQQRIYWNMCRQSLAKPC